MSKNPRGYWLNLTKQRNLIDHYPSFGQVIYHQILGILAAAT
jgi:hypothetical protein